MQIYVGADYRGFEWKERVVGYLASLAERGEHYNIEDMGTYEQTEGDDYNDPAIAVAKAVRESPGAFGILICGSGHGVTMQANRFKGIRAAKCESADAARMAREHDDANVLCMVAETLNEEVMQQIVDTFIATTFDNSMERRVRRINRLDEREDYD